MAPTYFGDSDLSVIFADAKRRGAAVTVSTAGWPDMIGITDYVGRDVLASLNVAGISGTVITVTVQTSKLPASLRNRTAFTMDGQSLKLRDSLQEGDGALTHLFFERA